MKATSASAKIRRYTLSDIRTSLQPYSTGELLRLQASVKRGLLGHGTHCNPDCICYTQDMALSVIEDLLTKRAQEGAPDEPEF